MCALPYFIQDRSAYAIDGNIAGTAAAVNMTSARSLGKKVPMCENDTLHGDDGCNAAVDSAQASANEQDLRVKRVAYYLIAFGMVRNLCTSLLDWLVLVSYLYINV